MKINKLKRKDSLSWMKKRLARLTYVPDLTTFPNASLWWKPKTEPRQLARIYELSMKIQAMEPFDLRIFET